MKLNKVLALALSGVMAVSMLAGCSGNPGNGGQEGENQPPVADTTIAGVLNDKIEDEKLDYELAFTYSNNLQQAAEQVLRVTGGLKKASSTDASNYEKAIASYLDMDQMNISALKATTPVTGSKTAITVKFVDGMTEEAAKKEAVKSIISDIKTSALEAEKEVAGNPDLKYNFTYSGEVAVVSGDDNGTPVYMAIATITCTTSAPVEAK